MDGPTDVFDLPVVPLGLPREDTMLHLADAFDALAQVSQHVFSTINSRVAEVSCELDAISSQIDMLQCKIDCVRGNAKATRVLAPSRFPAQLSSFKDFSYQSLFACDRGELTYGQEEEGTPGVERRRSRRLIIRPFEESNLTNLVNEKSQFFTVPAHKVAREPTTGSGEVSQEEGLGLLPNNIKSISSLLMFNTTENPYKKYQLLDPLSGLKTKTRGAVERETAVRILGDAPTTLVENERLIRPPEYNITYKPPVGPMSEFDVAPTLNLPGLADISYSGYQGISIAPSAAPDLSQIPDLPDVNQSTVSIDDIPAVSAPLPSAPQMPGAPPPPPPPPPPPAPPSSTPSNAPPGPPPPPLPPGLPPPPPPPPPPPGPGEAVPKPPVAKPQKPAAEIEMPVPDGRSAFLSEITDPSKGISRLKKVSERKAEKKKAKEDAAFNGGSKAGDGGFMSELFKQINRRRDHISGRQGPENPFEQLDEAPSTSDTKDKEQLVKLPALPTFETNDDAESDGSDHTDGGWSD